MLYGLVNLTWFDLTTVGFTLSLIVVVQVINALWATAQDTEQQDEEKIAKRKSAKINELQSDYGSSANGEAPFTVPPPPPMPPAASKQGKLTKQPSEIGENSSSSFSSSSLASNASSAPTFVTSALPTSYSSSLPPSALLSTSSSATPPLSFRHSIGGLWNGSATGSLLPSIAISGYPDNLTDEYHEDEDTISLENLLPCDHTEIFSSRKISYIIDELLQTEGNYVSNLQRGMKNYGSLQKYDKLPETLRGEEKQQQLLGNIQEILDLHEKQILPLMMGNQRDLKTMFDEMSSLIEKHHFDCYVTFTMNKKTSMQLRKENREWLQTYQTDISDRLGIDSFLVQPIQRLTRYPLLLQQFISEFYKSGINCKPVLVSVCKLETRLRRLLEVVNQAEEVLDIDELPTELTVPSFGPFRRSIEFDASNLRTRKKYKSKVFLFDQYLICVEVRKRRLAYRNHYAWPAIELKLNTPKSVSLLWKASAGAGSSSSSSSKGSGKSSRDNSIREEYEFTATEASAVSQWLRCARRILEAARIEESRRGKLTLPMDLVLGAVFAIWFIWHFL